MLKETTCAFSGHRIIPKEYYVTLKQQVEDAVFSLIQKGFTDFCSGGALGFDQLAAEVVLHYKKLFPKIRLIMVLSCKNQDKFWNKEQQETYRHILSCADSIIYISETYYRGCMQMRNRYLVDASSCLLAYLKQDSGGTKYTVNYAKKNRVPVLLVNKPSPHQISFFSES